MTRNNRLGLSLLLLSQAGALLAQVLPDALLLKDYRPQPIHKIPVTEVLKAKYPAIDMHTHVYGNTPEEVLAWIKTQDEVGIAKTIVLTGATGAAFDALQKMYSKHADRFELWCGINYTGYDKPGFGPAARGGTRAVLPRRRSRRGGDQRQGGGHRPRRGCQGAHAPRRPAHGPGLAEVRRTGHADHLHIADPVWAYQTMDRTNDGLMNALTWRLDNKPISSSSKA